MHWQAVHAGHTMRHPAAVPGPRLLLLLLMRAGAEVHVQPRTLQEAECQQSETGVNCRSRNLSSLPQNLQPYVKTFDISKNYLQTLSAKDMVGFRALENLNISYNSLVTIERQAFQTVTQLRVLILASNFLDTKHFSNGRAFRSLYNLKTLDLSANNLGSTMVASYIANMLSLEELNLSWNKMGRLTSELFRGAPQLRVIRLDNSNILEIEVGTFKGMLQLRVLDLAKNHLRCITSFELTQLHILNLSYNALELFVAGEAEEQHQLLVLDLSHNHFRHFPVLPKVHRIQHLNLSDNAMIAMTPSLDESMQHYETALWFNEATRLDLFLAAVPRKSALSALRHVDLSRNRLSSVPFHFLSNLNALYSLNMAMNCIRKITLDYSAVSTHRGKYNMLNYSLRKLDLPGNDLQVLPRWLFHVCPNLETVDLAHNNIVPCTNDTADSADLSCTSFADIANLKHLSLCGNGLTLLPPYSFTRTPLISLDISENERLAVSKTSLDGLELSLQKLSLRKNHLVSSELDLPCLKSLKTLDLSDNHLDLLPPSLQCSPLENLVLRNNRMESIESKMAIRLSETLESLFIRGNPFHCCKLTWLERLRAGKVRVQDLEEVSCVPKLVNGGVPVMLDGDLRRTCPSSLPPIYPAVVVLAIIVSLLYGMRILVKKWRSSAVMFFKGNRVGSSSDQPSTVRRIEGTPTNIVTKV